MKITDTMGRKVDLQSSFLEPGMFGDGSDQAVTFGNSSQLTVLGITPTGSGTVQDPYVYLLSRSIFCSDLTVNLNTVVKASGYRIFCTGTLTNNGTISSDGNAGGPGAG